MHFVVKLWVGCIQQVPHSNQDTNTSKHTILSWGIDTLSIDYPSRGVALIVIIGLCGG
jgi:hypothetical protein